MRRHVAPLLAVALALSLTEPAFAVPPQPTANGSQAPATDASRSATGAGEAAGSDVEAAPDSPRASMKAYLELCRTGDFALAADYLDVPAASKKDGPGLAQRLKVVLDRFVGIDLDTLSPASAGDGADRLPPGIDEIGRLPGLKREPVRLSRRPGRWVFSRTTVEHIDGWYAALDDRWLRERLPPGLLRIGPKGLPYWQWALAPVVALGAWLVGRLLSYVVRGLLARLAKRTRTAWDDLMVAKSGPPLTFGLAVATVYVALPWLPIDIGPRAFIGTLLDAGLTLAFFWLALRAIDVTGERFLTSPKTKDEPSVRSLVPLLGGVTKVSVVALGVVAALSRLGFQVTSLLAGLGIGGIALALAAQKTIENLFGSISIGLDQPFRVGDYVKLDDALSGTVETIGLRSTRIRTLDRTLVTIPNGKLADLRVESFAARDRIRLACVIGLVYGTTAVQLRAVLAGLEAVLRARKELNSEGVSVRLTGLGASSIDIEVMAWFDTTDFDTFKAIREDVLFGFLEVVEKAGTSLAWPTQTIHLVREGAPEPVTKG